MINHGIWGAQGSDNMTNLFTVYMLIYLMCVLLDFNDHEIAVVCSCMRLQCRSFAHVDILIIYNTYNIRCFIICDHHVFVCLHLA